MTVDIILQELEIRINKIRERQDTESNMELFRYLQIRLREYESFKNWIEARITTPHYSNTIEE
jgi:hypothetical protein